MLRYCLEQVFALDYFTSPLFSTHAYGLQFVRNEAYFKPKKTLHNLSEGARKILTLPNAGGNSVFSEVFSYEILSNVFGLRLVHTEMELRYWPSGGKLTDYSVVTRGGAYVGVSVTRAMLWPQKTAYDLEDADRLLDKKLEGIVQSSRNVYPKFHRGTQILHILAESPAIADTLCERLYQRQTSPHYSSTFVVLTTCQNAGWMFRQRRSKNKKSCIYT